MEGVTITFNELRRIKDALPNGSTQKMADLLNTSADTIRNYFGGTNFENGKSAGIHYEQGGSDGGLVSFDDATILNLAKKVLKENHIRW
jgi:di/tripeptidase